MKFPLLAILVLMMTTPAAVQSAQKDFDLPALHKIHEVTLSPSYSCRSAEDPKEDYGNTALFLTSSLKESNSPDLIFNGTCNGRDYVEAGWGGPQMSMIADLGKIRLEDLRTIQAFNVPWVGAQKFFSRFTGQIEPELDHTYALVINQINAG